MGKKVLIVDDSAVMRKIVERSLRQAGVEVGEVVEANNGVEALALVKDGAFDLILSDINMPMMDGLEFVRQLQEVDNAKNVPVVMLTARSRSEDVVAGLESGAEEYLAKPFEVIELVARPTCTP